MGDPEMPRGKRHLAIEASFKKPVNMEFLDSKTLRAEFLSRNAKGFMTSRCKDPPFESPVAQAPVRRGQQLECHDSPPGWKDLHGKDCYDYRKGLTLGLRSVS